MLIDEKLLIELFEQKDRKRREALFELFHDDLLVRLTRARIADVINGKLGRPGLVTADDVRYCRFYFKNKSNRSANRPVEKARAKPDQSAGSGDNPLSTFKVTDPDQIRLQDKLNYKSKHSNKQ